MLENEAMEARFGISLPAVQVLRLYAIRFGVREVSETEALLRNAGIAYDKRSGGLVIHPAPGQGATFVFEAE
jgi:hypothetical protein